QIQWFPGHMTKALRMMEDNLKLVDGAVCVLDARAPFACFNKRLISVFNNKPVLYLINKTDLISAEDKSVIAENLKARGIKFLFTVGTEQRDMKAVYNVVTEMFSEKLQAKKERGVNKTLRFMVCGVPNTGKSTVINSLAGKKQAQTGDKAGVTKGKQWIRLNGLELLDTPGTMPPSFENQTYAHHLAYIGSINDDILDIESLCLDFIEELSAKNDLALSERYGVDIKGEPLEIFDAICKSRGYFLRGGESDYTRCAKAVLDDFRKGRLGKICLETEPVA
ncbi:MAG: ribosome biogenesis GTPase YlqF, partial [Clostridia bacterium]|nr:ribosome biogenesis GTPase YlqF [Clostridia bacterium]